MATVAGKWKAYNLAKKRVGDGTFELDDGTNWRLSIFLSTSNANTLGVGTNVYGDLTNEHATSHGYTAGGVALTNVTWTESGGIVTFDCDDVLTDFIAAGGSITGRLAVIYKNATVNGVVKPILCVCILKLVDGVPTDVTATDGNPLRILMHGSGVLRLAGATED